MQQVADWLEKLGLGQYAPRFAENDISFAVLPDLTDQHLKEIGVSLGHRLQLLRAIAELTSREKDAPRAAVATAPTAAPQDTAERRQVTVMFSDLVGSTALSARMDPEDLREVISAYQKCVADTVRRFGGFVAKYMGDGVLVYFGYPQAHEDDAERAVRAGLELSCGWAEVWCAAANSRGHQHGVGRSRRSNRVWCGSGASGCRGDAEPGRPSVGRRNSNFCFGAGQKQRPAKVRWCSCLARQASASRGWPRRSWNGFAAFVHC
jgi:SAM domain (Sterile alpha motif)/Adenylate and Guanylate cyclase catalytic domain